MERLSKELRRLVSKHAKSKGHKLKGWEHRGRVLNFCKGCMVYYEIKWDGFEVIRGDKNSLCWAIVERRRIQRRKDSIKRRLVPFAEGEKLNQLQTIVLRMLGYR